MPAFLHNGTHRNRARHELRRRLRLAAELEQKAGAELDRLISIALEQGLRPVDIAALSGLSANAISMRKSKPIFCEDCGVPMGYRGRGRPPRRCGDCR